MTTSNLARTTTIVIFDEVVCSVILSYIPPQDWGGSKPFLITSTFHMVCQSEEFSKQYLINLFKLSSEQVEHLEFACSLFNNNNANNNNNNSNSGGDEKKRRKKKRKITDDQVLTDQFKFMQVSCSSLKQVLWTYFHMSYAFDSETIKQEIIVKLERHRKGVYDTSAERLLKFLTFESYLLKSFNYFTSEEPQRIMTRSKDVIISDSVLLSVFGNVQDLFLIDYEENGSNSVINFCLFTSCGYPLFIKSEYYTSVSGFVSERLDVFGKLVFMHQLKLGIATDHFDKEKLDKLQQLLFHKNADKLLLLDNKRIGSDGEDLADVKLALLYEFLQCCFGMNGTMFRRYSMGWVPFVGKVRGVVRELGSTDFGYSDDDSSDDDDDEEEEEDDEELYNERNFDDDGEDDDEIDETDE